MRAFLTFLAFIALALPVAAQDNEEDRDPGFIAGLIEDNLAAPGLSVRIDGFEGALSSRATLDRLAIADDEGTWLVLQDVVLDWNRSALLRGRLEVQELSAGLISVERAPLPPEGVEALPDAGASGFSLPDLPVSVNIETLRAERIELGAPLLGQAVALTLEASAQLADGSAEVSLEAQRLDGPRGVFDIDARYAGESQELAVDIEVSEGPEGIVATLAGLPGGPALDLSVEGAGPLDDFEARIALASDGTERLGGTVTLTGIEAGRRFAVDLGGDVTTLFAPRYQPFFGPDVQLVAEGVQRPDGALELQELDIQTAALSVDGAARLGPDGWPTFLDISAVVQDADGTPVLLPSAANSQLQEARLTLRHDASVSDNWRLELTAQDYRQPDLTVGAVDLVADGILSREDGAVARATAAVDAALRGLEFADPALGEAVGPRAVLEADVEWNAGQPVRITDLELEGAAYALTGRVGIGAEAAAGAEEDEEAAASGLPIRLDLVLDHDRLSALAALAGVDLSGTARAEAAGTIDPLAGTFDLSLDAVTRDLGLGIAQVDPLLEGETTLSLDARRTVDGTFVDALRLGNDELTASGQAQLLAEDSAPYLQGQRSSASFEARIADGTLIDPRLDGAIELAADVTQTEDGTWRGTVDAVAPQGVTLSASGELTGESPAVDFAANVPDLSAFAEGIPGGLALTGRAAAENGIWSLDAQASGPWDVTARVSGPVTGPTPEITFDARLPDLSGPVPALSEFEALQGAVDLSGTLAQTGGVWSLDSQAQAPAGITLRLRGPLTGDAAPNLEFAATVPEVSDIVPAVEGRLDLDGAVFAEGEDFALRLRAAGPYDAVVTANSVLTAQPLTVDFTAELPSLAPLAPVPGGLNVTGTAVQTADGFRIDLDGTGPYDATLDVGVDLSAGVPAITASGQIPDSSAIAPQLRGPLNYAAYAVQTDEGWRVEAEVDGAQGLSAEVEGLATGPDMDLDFRLRAANVAAFAPGLSGPLDASGRLFMQDGNLAIDLDAGGPLGATLTADGTLAGGDASARFDLRVPNIAPLVPDISGPLAVSGTIDQQGAAYRVDIDLDGPAGTQASVTGTARTDATLNLDVTGSAPLGLANGILAPRQLAGTAQFDLSVNGPAGLDAVSGTVTTSGATLSLPTLRNSLDGIDATVRLSGGRAVVDLGAGLGTGGRIAVTGPVQLSPPFDAALGIQFDVTLVDPSLYEADLSGNVSVTGPLTGGALIAGVVNIDGAEIAVPSTGLTAVGDLPPIDHLGATRPVQRTLARAGQLDAAAEAGADAAPSGPPYRLDLTINAPGRIFVRGRGLDAELGGQLQLGGTVADPLTAGGFELLRGRLDILQQRFELDEGRITFAGGFVPFIRLVAVTETDTLTASIIIEGPADDIQVRFESTPDVPQEEILAQIFFGRDLSSLSPLQALQLANSVAVLAGRGSGGLLETLRGSSGLDDLDVTTDDEGNVALRAGKYISDNVYTDVQIDQEGDAEVSLNLDLTPNLTVRGSAGAAGNTSLGVFFEKDY